jgi:CheY-like chemotaxis protein
MSSPVGGVLVVDDAPNIAAMLRHLLGDLDHVVHLASTGAEALRLLPELQPDVVLIDVGLPDTPGELVLTRLREANYRLPVVMITGTDDAELAHRTLAHGRVRLPR